jgi:hypothetical protein
MWGCLPDSSAVAVAYTAKRQANISHAQRLSDYATLSRDNDEVSRVLVKRCVACSQYCNVESIIALGVTPCGLVTLNALRRTALLPNSELRRTSLESHQRSLLVFTATWVTPQRGHVTRVYHTTQRHVPEGKYSQSVYELFVSVL